MRALLLALFLSSLAACGGPQLDKTIADLRNCEAERDTTKNSFENCRDRQDEILNEIGKHLEEILNKNPSVGVAPDPVEIPPEPPAAEPMTLARIQKLQGDIAQRFESLDKKLGRLEHELRSLGVKSSEQQAKLGKIGESTNEIGQTLDQTDALRAQIDDARRARTAASQAYREAAAEVAASIREFDRRELTCADCDKRARRKTIRQEVLEHHAELLEQLERIVLAAGGDP